VQSVDDDVLAYLGREHRKEHVPAAIEIFRNAGINNINCDLIYGSANESSDSWKTTLETVLSYQPQHLSAYALGIEQGTPLARDVNAGIKGATDEDDLADKYEVADEILSTHGFGWYEISNWSQPHKESIHNLTYWRGGDVIALGCAAHGYTNGKRWSTPRSIDAYLAKFSAKNAQLDEVLLDQNRNEIIDESEEKFALQLRTREGIMWPSPPSGLDEFHSSGLIQCEDNRIFLTRRGRLLAHRVTIDLYEHYAKIDQPVE
jgi:oxygen-independent coproporphyrinogen-3 oxidase